MIAEVVKGDRISRAGVAMFEKIAEVFKEEVVRQIVLSIRWRTIKAVQGHGSLREGQCDMENSKYSVGERSGLSEEGACL